MVSKFNYLSLSLLLISISPYLFGFTLGATLRLGLGQLPDCSFCLEPVYMERNAFITRCGHFFHNDCVSRLKPSEIPPSFHCPNCWEPITKYSSVEYKAFFSKNVYNENDTLGSVRQAGYNRVMNVIVYLNYLKLLILREGHYEEIEKVVNILISKGWDINERFEDGNTMLHYASFNGNDQAVRLLLDRGADIDACDYNNNNALYFADTQNHGNIAQNLIYKRIKPGKNVIRYLICVLKYRIKELLPLLVIVIMAVIYMSILCRIHHNQP